jgi:hypothetical protein
MVSAQLRHIGASIKALSTNRPTTAVAENAAFARLTSAYPRDKQTAEDRPHIAPVAPAATFAERPEMLTRGRPS